jgi:glycogen(starch) synthase
VRLLCVASRYLPWSLGGYEAITAGAVTALRERGHSVEVLTTLPDPSDRPAPDAIDPDVHRELRWYWREHSFRQLSLRQCAALERANAAALARRLATARPNAIVWWAMGGMSLSLLEQARAAAVPGLAVVGDDWMVYGPHVDRWTARWHGWRRGFAPLAARAVSVPARVDLDRCARYLFISEHVRAAAAAAGWRLPGAGIVHPGVDAARFARSEPGPWAWRLLYCGRIDARKGIDTAVRALPGLPGRATLTIDGDGDGRHADELSSLAERLGVGERVRFQCSAPADVPAAYARADAVVFPVVWKEPWGLVPLEAMAVGRPVVATRAGGGPAEYLDEGRNCLLFEPDDAAGLAAQLRALNADELLRQRLAAGGRATAARFTSEAFYARIEAELERL